ncbi:MAG: hypothetical protein QM783_05210 [Phycisphaerales bacterium]
MTDIERVAAAICVRPFFIQLCYGGFIRERDVGENAVTAPSSSPLQRDIQDTLFVFPMSL